jgi:hypothetical protein
LVRTQILIKIEEYPSLPNESNERNEYFYILLNIFPEDQL